MRFRLRALSDIGQRGNRTSEFGRAAFEGLSTGVPLRPFRLIDTRAQPGDQF